MLRTGENALWKAPCRPRVKRALGTADCTVLLVLEYLHNQQEAAILSTSVIPQKKASKLEVKQR